MASLKNNSITALVTVIVVLALLWGGYVVAGRLGLFSTAGATTNKDAYSAVFLTNGQVYFGKIDSMSSANVSLKDIYYLQVNQALQNTQTGTQPSPSPSPDIVLVKLGEELHGPVDHMDINRDHVLFIEELKTDGRVAKAIQDYKNK